MMLLTKELRKKLEKHPLGKHSEEDAKDVKIIVKFFDPCSQWTWYVSEFDGVDMFFGLVRGHETEFGYFSLAELESIRGRWGLGIERDRHFGDHTLQEAKDKAI